MSKKKTTVSTSTEAQPKYVRIETGGLDELEGLLTGIHACAKLAKAHYDHDHVNFDGLAELADRALFVLFELTDEERQKAGAQ